MKIDNFSLFPCLCDSMLFESLVVNKIESECRLQCIDIYEDSRIFSYCIQYDMELIYQNSRIFNYCVQYDMELIYQNSRIFNGETNEYTLKAKKLFETVEGTLGLYQVSHSNQNTSRRITTPQFSISSSAWLWAWNGFLFLKVRHLYPDVFSKCSKIFNGTKFVGNSVSKMNPTLFSPSLAGTRGTELRIQFGWNQRYRTKDLVWLELEEPN